MENLNQYKSGKVSLSSHDELTRHSPSFYSYRGVDRFYKFFESRNYFMLEKKYPHMRTLDVTRCFDSIYTHSMSWAIKDKGFTKKNVSVNATFAQEFDRLMQCANYLETNGIVIGPEISRIFAEIIFQRIDNEAINRIKTTNSLDFDNQYTFRRYVDDVIIYSDSEETGRIIYETYADVLASFNMHPNHAKSTLSLRPFITKKSKLIQETKVVAEAFFNKFLKEGDGYNLLLPKSVHNPWRLTRSFIQDIKSLCSSNNVNYDEISSYLISAYTERVKKLVSVSPSLSHESESKDYADVFLVILEILFFLYQTSPSVSASYKLSTSIILTVRFFKRHLPKQEHTISQRIHELYDELLLESSSRTKSSVADFVPLEVLNILLASRELGNNYLLPPDTLEKIFDTEQAHSYFSIVSCLYYIRDDAIYKNLMDAMLSSANSKLEDMSDILMDSEKAYLLLDLITCPYISGKNKKKWVREAFGQMGHGKLTNAEIEDYLNFTKDIYTHINWKEVDLLSALEKKELKKAY